MRSEGPGRLAEAEETYRAANAGAGSHNPVARGSGWRRATSAAAAAIRRGVGESGGPIARAALLGALVEIMVAAGDLDGPSARAPSSIDRAG